MIKAEWSKSHVDALGLVFACCAIISFFGNKPTLLPLSDHRGLLVSPPRFQGQACNQVLENQRIPSFGQKWLFQVGIVDPYKMQSQEFCCNWWVKNSIFPDGIIKYVFLYYKSACRSRAHLGHRHCYYDLYVWPKIWFYQFFKTLILHIYLFLIKFIGGDNG